MNSRRIIAITAKEWREILRDRVYFLLAFLLPAMLMIVFGYGLSQEVKNIPFVVLDYDHSRLSRQYAHRFIDSRYFDFKGYLRDLNQAEPLLTDGKVRLVIVIPDSFQQRLFNAETVSVQTLIDGVFTIPLRTIDGYVQAISAAASAELQVGYLSRRLGISHQRAQTLLQPIKLEVRYLFNQELRDIWSISSSLIMFILSLTAPLLLALSVVREKESGTIYTIYASTISRSEFLIGKLIPYAIVSFINAIVLLLLATLYFGAPLKGDLGFFLVATLIYVFCASSVGLLISLAVGTQLAAIMITTVITMIVAMQFSGMMTPVSSMTGVNYWLAQLFPPKYFNDVIAQTFLKGGGLSKSWPEITALMAFFLGYLGLAYRLFHKRTRA